MDHSIDFEFEVSVKSLLEKKFSTLSFAEKKQIIAQRPTPDLNITQLKRSKHRDFTRTFNSDKYAKFKFLAGCPTKKNFIVGGVFVLLPKNQHSSMVLKASKY